MSKFLICGLGNIGDEYANTRHNIGFDVVDEVANNLGGLFTLDRLANVAHVKHKGKILVLIKPTTYMNLSGKALNYWLQQEKIEIKNTLVITDDIALPAGALRMKMKGGDGGHNGLKSIQETILSADYARLRFGVGNNFSKGKQSDYVLGKWTSEELKIINERIFVAAEMVKSFCTIGVQLTMTNFNNK
jgi:PTH1 family peptidyl-tRNA hydrolase